MISTTIVDRFSYLDIDVNIDSTFEVLSNCILLWVDLLYAV